MSKSDKFDFDSVFENNKDSITRLCYMYLNDYHLAQDAAQETFIKVYKSYSSFKHKSDIKTWITRIAINTCKNIIRKRSFKERTVSIEEVPIKKSDDTLLSDTKITITSEISKLPLELREVIILKYYSNMKISNISNTLKIPETAVNYRLLQAKKILKSTIKEDVFYD